MKVAFYTNIVSPHQLPFARELVKRIGVENYRYICSESFHAERRNMGWNEEQEPWILSETEHNDESRFWLEEADILIVCLRDLALIERRCARGLRTFYASERWFKPVFISTTPTFNLNLCLPGWVRLFVPTYFKMTWRFVSLVRKYDAFRILPYGVWAERDFRLIGVPTDKMTVWGYAVAPTDKTAARGIDGLRANRKSAVRVLWAGRMLKLKNVDIIIRAVVFANRKQQRSFSLTLVGDGPEKMRLQRLACRLQKDLPSPIVTFSPTCPIEEVRTIMRQHDIYVFASNALDGWGAVVSEALEEGLICLGSCKSGAPATLLPLDCQFEPNDVEGLSKLLMAAGEGELPYVGIGTWNATGLAERFMALIDEPSYGHK